MNSGLNATICLARTHRCTHTGARVLAAYSRIYAHRRYKLTYVKRLLLRCSVTIHYPGVCSTGWLDWDSRQVGRTTLRHMELTSFYAVAAKLRDSGVSHVLKKKKKEKEINKENRHEYYIFPHSFVWWNARGDLNKIFKDSSRIIRRLYAIQFRTGLQASTRAFNEIDLTAASELRFYVSFVAVSK